MPTNQTGLGISPMLALLPADQQQSLMQLQQQQAIGQALLQQGLAPIDTSGRQVGGMGYRISPLEGLAKMANMYIGNKLSRDSMGQQAQIMGQLYGNAFGGGQQAPQAAPTDAGGMTGDQLGAGVVSAPVATPGAPSGAQLGAAMGGAPAQVGPQTQMANGALTLPGRTPQQSMLIFSMLGPEAYGHMLEAQTAPTAATLAARQGGFDPLAANQAQFRKDSYVAPLTGTGIMRNPFNPSQPVGFNPEVPAGAAPLFDASGNVAAMQPIQGAQGVMQGNAAATAAGEGSQLPFDKGVDAQGNPLPVMSRTQAATGSVPLPLRNNNPGAVSPGGSVAKYPDMQTGLQKMDTNLAGYANDPKIKTIGDAITKWVGSPPNAPAYIKDVTSRLGISANTPVDLTNPAQRQAISTAIMLHENGAGAVFGGAQRGAAPAQGGGAIYAAPPMGAQANAEAQAKAQIDTMQKSYQGIMPSRAGGGAAIQDIDNMVGLASGKPGIVAGKYATQAAALVSSSAAEYEKARDNLVTNLGSQLGIGSDAAREMVYGSVPAYGAPHDAVVNGLATLKGQVQMRMQKADFMSGAYAKQDAVGYNQRDNAFDQNMTPALASLVAMPASPARSAALKQAQTDPQTRARLTWAAENGVLK